MPIADSLKSIRYVTDQAGHPTGVLVDIEIWNALLAWTEDATDRQLAATALRELSVAGGRPADACWQAREDARGGWLEEDESA